MQGPDTDAQDQPPPFFHFRLATHGRRLSEVRSSPDSRHCDATSACPFGAMNRHEESHGSPRVPVYYLGQRFLGSNHIRQRRRVCKTKCG